MECKWFKSIIKESWFIRCINNYYIKKYITYESPDVIFMEETKLEQNDKNYERLLKGYTGYINCCSPVVKVGYSGVALFSRNLPNSVFFGIGKSEVF